MKYLKALLSKSLVIIIVLSETISLNRKLQKKIKNRDAPENAPIGLCTELPLVVILC